MCTVATLLIPVLLVGFFSFRSCSTEESGNKRKCTGKLVKITMILEKIIPELYFGFNVHFLVLILRCTFF